MMKKIAFALLLCLQSSLFAAPFGLKMGMTAEEVESACDMRKVQFEEDDWFYFFPQKRHSMFENYVARIDKKFGLYFVRAVGYEIRTDGYGTSLKNALDEIKEKLSKSYGEPRLVDELDPNYSEEFWHYDTNEWFSSILLGRRVYKYVWDNAKNLPNDILNIEAWLYISNSPRCGKVVIDYELANLKDLQDEEDTFF